MAKHDTNAQRASASPQTIDVCGLDVGEGGYIMFAQPLSPETEAELENRLAAAQARRALKKARSTGHKV